ncbi:MAG: MFS family permease [Francisellaceae bacterium]|jgi:MFS family permease
MSKNIMQWIVVEAFFVVSVFSAMLFGIYSHPISVANQLSSIQVGILSGVFFGVFSLVQLFVGRIITRVSPRYILSISALIAAIGSIVFSISSVYGILILGRVLLGLGLGGTFVGVLAIIESGFGKNNFAFMSSLSQSVANAFSGSLGLVAGYLFTQYSYNQAFYVLGILFFILSIFLFFVLRGVNFRVLGSSSHEEKLLVALWNIIKNKYVWLAAIYFSGMFGAILTYADLFNVTFQVQVFNLSLYTAIIVNSMIPLGVAIGGIIAGLWAKKRQNHALPSQVFSAIAFATLFIILLIRFPNHYRDFFAGGFCFIFGFGCGGAMLAFQEVQVRVTNEYLRPLANSIILTVAYITSGLVLQPLISWWVGNGKSTKVLTSPGVSNTDMSLWWNIKSAATETSKATLNFWDSVKNMASNFEINHPIISLSTMHHSITPEKAKPYFIWLFDPEIKGDWYQHAEGLSIIILVLLLSFISSLFFAKKLQNKQRYNNY